MLLSKTCVCAIRASLEVAARTSNGGRKYVPIREVSDSLGLSFHFLGKVTQLLNDAGLMTSFKGPNGGVGLARPADQVFLIDVIQATDGLGVFEKCILGLPECREGEPCTLHRTWDHSREELLKELEKESLASILMRRCREESRE